MDIGMGREFGSSFSSVIVVVFVPNPVGFRDRPFFVGDVAHSSHGVRRWVYSDELEEGGRRDGLVAPSHIPLRLYTGISRNNSILNYIN